MFGVICIVFACFTDTSIPHVCRLVGEVEKGQSKVYIASKLKNCSHKFMNWALQCLVSCFKSVVDWGGYTPPGHPSIFNSNLGLMPGTLNNNLGGKIYPTMVQRNMKTTVNSIQLSAHEMANVS